MPTKQPKENSVEEIVEEFRHTLNHDDAKHLTTTLLSFQEQVETKAYNKGIMDERAAWIKEELKNHD